MFGKNRNKKVGLCVMVVTASLVLAGLWAVLATPETALADKPDAGEHNHGDDDGGGTGFAQVTISGPMQTDGAHSFGLDKDSNQTLELNSWSGADRGGAVPIRFNFDTGSCSCREGNNWEKGIPYTPCDLTGHLVDSETETDFPYRWNVIIRVDMSNLTVGNSWPTNYKGGHSIDITTDPDQTPTITGTVERLWIPEGPNKSGPVTVTWVSNTEVSGKRVRVFEFTSFKIQVVSNPSGSQKKEQERKIMRCDNLDGPIVVTVVTPL